MLIRKETLQDCDMLKAEALWQGNCFAEGIHMPMMMLLDHHPGTTSCKRALCECMSMRAPFGNGSVLASVSHRTPCYALFKRAVLWTLTPIPEHMHTKYSMQVQCFLQ